MGSPVIQGLSVGAAGGLPKGGASAEPQACLGVHGSERRGAGQGGMGRSQGQLPGEVRRAVPPPAPGESGVVRQVFQGGSEAREELGQGQECLAGTCGHGRPLPL